jgi:hypothetical protein
MAMKKTAVLILAIACILNVSCAAARNDSERIVHELSSPAYSGRLVGTDGNEKAVDFIEKEFQRAGLQPLLSGNYRQSFPLDCVDLSGTDSRFVLEYADGTTHELTFGTDYFMRAGFQDVDVDLPLNFGPDPQPDSDSIHVISDLKRYDLEKAPVLIIDREEIVYTPGVPTEGSPMRIYIPANVVERVKLTQVVRAQVKSKGGTTQVEVANVVGCIPGKDRTKAIVLTAHLDGCGKQGSFFFPGALDNASGISVVIGCAKSLKEALGKEMPDTDIVFAAVNSEEFSDGKTLKGSTALVEQLESSYKDFYDINIDCVGLDRPFSMSVLDTRSAGLNAALRTSFSLYGLKCDESEYAPSDHRSFLSSGHAAVVVGQTALGQTLQTHRTVDVPDAIDFTVVDKVIRAVCQMIRVDGSRIFETTKEGSESDEPRLDDNEWWENARMEGERILDRRILAYDERMDFKYDGIWFTLSGWRPFTSVEEAREFYPDFHLSSFAGSSLTELEILAKKSYSSIVAHPGNDRMKDAQIGVIQKIVLSREEIFQIVATFKISDQFRRITLCKASSDPFLKDGTAQNLTGDLNGIQTFRNSWDGPEDYSSIHAPYGSWWIEIREYTIGDVAAGELAYPPVFRTQKETEEWAKSLGMPDGLEQIIEQCGLDKIVDS